MVDSNTLMTFGKWKDKPLSIVPNDYLVHIYDKGIAAGELREYIEKNAPLIQAQIRAQAKKK